GAGAQDPDGDLEAFSGEGPDFSPVVFGTEVALQLLDFTCEVVMHVHPVAPEGHGGQLISARRPPQAQVDPPRIHRFQGAELFGDDQGCMVRQHNAAGADPDMLCFSGHMADKHGGSRAGDVFHIMMLSQPDTAVAQALDMARYGNGAANSLGNAFAGSYGSQIQEGYGNGCHGPKLLYPAGNAASGF